jgi:hypothetical protein
MAGPANVGQTSGRCDHSIRGAWRAGTQEGRGSGGGGTTPGGEAKGCFFTQSQNQEEKGQQTAQRSGKEKLFL